MKVITITGSVGSGKTTLSKKLAKFSGFDYVDVHKIIKQNKLKDGYDKKKKCDIIDIRKLNIVLIKLIKKSKCGLIIDSHLSHYLSTKYVDLCIVAKCDLKILRRRLKKRGYGEKKIMDNLEAEIFNVCLEEAKGEGHKILIVDTSREINKEVLSLIV